MKKNQALDRLCTVLVIIAVLALLVCIGAWASTSPEDDPSGTNGTAALVSGLIAAGSFVLALVISLWPKVFRRKEPIVVVVEEPTYREPEPRKLTMEERRARAEAKLRAIASVDHDMKEHIRREFEQELRDRIGKFGG